MFLIVSSFLGNSVDNYFLVTGWERGHTYECNKDDFLFEFWLLKAFLKLKVISNQRQTFLLAGFLDFCVYVNPFCRLLNS